MKKIALLALALIAITAIVAFWLKSSEDNGQLPQISDESAVLPRYDAVSEVQSQGTSDLADEPQLLDKTGQQQIPHTEPEPAQTEQSDSDHCDLKPVNMPPDLEDELADYFNRLLGWDFTWTQYNEYLDYDETALKVLAESGDARAMLTLGINYRWYAQFTNFDSPLIRNSLPASKPKKREQLDVQIMQQSLYWLERAAYHGLPTALLEQKRAYELLIEAGSPSPLVPDQETLKIHSVVIEHFIHNVLPDYSLVSFNIANLNNLEPSQQQTYEQKLNDLNRNWQQQRDALQLPHTITLNKSPQLLTVLSNMQKCLQE